MNGQSRMDSCAKCASTNLMRNGKNRVGNARYKCNDCSYCGVVKSRRAAVSLKERATAMGQERSSLRGIARVLACSADSESNWIRKSLLLLSSNDSGLAAGSRPLSKAVKTRPMLELCLFESHFRLDLGRSLSSYQTNLLFYHRGDQAWATGQQLWLDTPKDHQCNYTYSDYRQPYLGFLDLYCHYQCYNDEGQTNHIERYWATLRNRLARLTHKTLSYSKIFDPLKGLLTVFVYNYNH